MAKKDKMKEVVEMTSEEAKAARAAKHAAIPKRTLNRKNAKLSVCFGHKRSISMAKKKVWNLFFGYT